MKKLKIFQKVVNHIVSSEFPEELVLLPLLVFLLYRSICRVVFHKCKSGKCNAQRSRND